MNIRRFTTLLLLTSALRAANPSAPADFTIGTHVVVPNPERFGLNLRDPAQYNNFSNDPGFEPVTIKRQHTATGGGTNYIDNVPANGPTVYSAGTWHYQTMADGFFDGAHVRVYRPSAGGLQFVREGTVSDYVTNGWRRLHTLPLRNSQFTDTTAAPGITYEYQIRAVNTSHVVSTNHSVDVAMATVTPLAGAATPTTPAYYSGSFYVRNTTPPTIPSGLSAAGQPGAVALDWNDNPETDLAGYYVYRRTLGAPQFRIYLDSTGPNVEPGDIYFLEMTVDNAPVEFMHDRLGSNTVTDTWRILGGTAWPYSQPATSLRDPSTVCPENGGRTSLRIDNPGTHEVSIRQPRFSAPQFFAGYYPNLTPGEQYRVEVWLKQTGIPNSSVRFSLTQHYSSIQTSWTVGNTWQKFTYTFRAPALPTTGTISEIMLAFNGPGTLWVDNLLLYEDADGDRSTHPPFSLNAQASQALSDFRPSYLRIFTGVDTAYWGSTLADWTDAEPVIQPHWEANTGRHVPDDPYKLPMALAMCRDCGANPWLVVGSYFTEQEWPALIEYLAAPYDPLLDTPASKPWAKKRYEQGQHAPWTDVFPSMQIEYGNELWNPIFEWNFGSGNMAGQFSEYFFTRAKQSPYYAAVASKLHFTVNGWHISTGQTNGYGHAAALAAPSAEFSDVADYIGGWESGLAIGGNTINDAGYQDYMVFAPTYIRYFTDQHVASRDANAAAGHPYRLSVYEGGPGYANPTPGAMYEPVSEAYGKSLAAAVATMDTFLYNSLRGIDPQCYFTFAPGYNWATHSTYATGYSPHVNYLALQMRNRRVTGSMVATATHSVPSIDVAQRTNNTGNVVLSAMPNTPLTSLYAFRHGADYRVFLLSRKLTGDTPVTLRLPFGSISSGTIYKITGDPRATNATAMTIAETQEPLTNFSANYTFSMPPGSIYLLEFLGTNAIASTDPSAEISRGPTQADPTNVPAVTFAVDFSRPVTGFTVSDLQVSGTAFNGATPSVTLTQGSPFLGTNYLVNVGNFTQDGTVTLTIPAGAANAVDTGAPTAAPTLIDNSIDFAFPPVQNVVLAYDDFDAAPQFLHGLSTGSGWSQPWQIPNYNAATYGDGYKLGTASAPRTSSLRTLGSYAIGGRGYEFPYRGLNTAAFGSYVALGSNPAAIGQDGTTLWFSVVLRKETNDNAPIRFDLVSSDGTNDYSRIDLGVGYYGTSSNSGGQRYWTMATLRDNSTLTTDFTLSNAPVIIGEPALLVVKARFGVTDRFDLFVNPPNLGTSEPTTPNATRTTPGGVDIRFRSSRFRTGLGYGYDSDGTNNGLNKGSLDEIRFGDSFAAVTPPLTAVELWRQQRFGSWQPSGNAADSADPDGDGETNAYEYAFGGNPMSADGPHRPRCSTTRISNEDRLTLAFTADPANSDTSYIVESTADVASGLWVPLATRLGSTAWSTIPGVSVQQDSAGNIVVTDNVALGASTSRFLRVRALR